MNRLPHSSDLTDQFQREHYTHWHMMSLLSHHFGVEISEPVFWALYCSGRVLPGVSLIGLIDQPLLVWPRADGALSDWVQWLTVTHVRLRRWHAHHHTGGTGPVYQGRFKSFPVQDDDHYYTVCRYAERNPLRANLVDRAERWHWDWRAVYVRGAGRRRRKSRMSPFSSSSENFIVEIILKNPGGEGGRAGPPVADALRFFWDSRIPNRVIEILMVSNAAPNQQEEAC